MKRLFVTIVLLASFLALTVQSAPAQVPSASPTAVEDAPTTEAAKKFYESLVAGTPDRSHMSSELNNALTDDLVKTISRQLGALGVAKWAFLRDRDSPYGPIAEYRLAFANGINVYYAFGQTAKHTIFAASLSNSDPAAQ